MDSKIRSLCYDHKVMSSPDNDEVDLLIVGAGPTGLTLACFCSQLGLRLRIIDKNSGPSRTSKAIGLQYRTSEILALLGVVQRFIDRGGSPTPVNIYDATRKLVTFHFDLADRISGRDAFRPRPILIPQSETEKLLGELLEERGGRVEWNAEFLDFSQKDDAVFSSVGHTNGTKEIIRSRYLVSCEGAHSVIRKQAGITFQGEAYPLAFIIADIEIDWNLNHNENHVWMHKEGSFAALPMPGGVTKWRLFFEVSDDFHPSGEVSLPLIQQLIRSRTGNESLQAQNPVWLSEFRINCRMVDKYRVGRVFLAGNAAHVHSPTGGQGITTGVQDSINLAWKLARVLSGAPDVAFEFSTSGKRITLFELLRNVQPIVLFATENENVEHLLDGALAQLDIACYCLASKSELKKTSRNSYLLDVHDDFAEFYGLKNEFLCLIRPDGHIGLLQHPVNLNTFRDYLLKICPMKGVEKCFPF